MHAETFAAAVWQHAMAHAVAISLIASLIAIGGVTMRWGRRVLLALLRWKNSLMQEARAESAKPFANILPVRGRVRPIGVSSQDKRPVLVPYNFGQVVLYRLLSVNLLIMRAKSIRWAGPKEYAQRLVLPLTIFLTGASILTHSLVDRGFPSDLVWGWRNARTDSWRP